MTTLSPEAQKKLETAQNIWFASVRPDGRPHLTPVWFAWASGRLYVSIDPEGVKSRNIAQNSQVVLALEDGLHPVICEGKAAPLDSPPPEEVLDIFMQKYEWDLRQEEQYSLVLQIAPQKWLAW